jgi:hypothetical protein
MGSTTAIITAIMGTTMMAMTGMTVKWQRSRLVLQW